MKTREKEREIERERDIEERERDSGREERETVGEIEWERRRWNDRKRYIHTDE